MASLADVNQTLMDQNESLADIARGTLETQELIQKQISADTGFKAIETSREKGGGIGGAVSGTLKGIQDTGKKLGSFFGGKGLAGIGAALIGGLVTRGIPALVAASLSDNIAEYLTGEEGNQEVKETIERSIIGGSLGFLLGWRGALIGSLLGALLTEDNRKNLEELGTRFGTLAEEFGMMLPTFEQTINFLSEKFGNLINFVGGIVGTVTGITRAIGAFTDDDETTSGFEELGKTAEDTFTNFKENALGAAIAVGGLFALLRPGKAIGLALAGIAGAAKGAGSLLSKLGGAGTAGAAAGAGTAAAGAAGAATAAATIVKKDGKEFVKSKSGKLFLRGTPQADMIETRGGTQAKPVADNVKKFPRLAKALKLLRGIPVIGGIAALTQLAMLDPKTVDGVAGILGGLGGSAVGAIIGGFFTGGNPIAAALGGIGGYFLGDALFKGLAQYLLGKKVDAFPGFINDMFNGKGGGTSESVDTGMIGGEVYTPGQPMSQNQIDASDIRMAMGGQLSDQEMRDYESGKALRSSSVQDSINGDALQTNIDSKNQPAVVMQDTSTKQVNNVSNSTQPVVAPMVNNLDVNDALMPYAQGI